MPGSVKTLENGNDKGMKPDDEIRKFEPVDDDLKVVTMSVYVDGKWFYRSKYWDTKPPKAWAHIDHGPDKQAAFDFHTRIEEAYKVDPVLFKTSAHGGQLLACDVCASIEAEKE
jgi:hypothetical protein